MGVGLAAIGHVRPQASTVNMKRMAYCNGGRGGVWVGFFLSVVCFIDRRSI